MHLHGHLLGGLEEPSARDERIRWRALRILGLWGVVKGHRVLGFSAVRVLGSWGPRVLGGL
eukprot:1920139-Amphidinium_carterae.1